MLTRLWTTWTWLKNVSCCRLAWHNFQKYVNSDPCKERKPCVKWTNGNTFLAISDFVDKRFVDNFAFRRLRTSSVDFGLLRESSEMIVSFSKSQHSQDCTALQSQMTIELSNNWTKNLKWIKNMVCCRLMPGSNKHPLQILAHLDSSWKYISILVDNLSIDLYRDASPVALPLPHKNQIQWNK